MANIQIRNCPGLYLHAIDLSWDMHWYPCNNLLVGNLYSPDFVALTNPIFRQSHHPIRNVPIEQLATGQFHLGFPTPRAMIISQTLLRNPQNIRGSAEILFERTRRVIAPDAPDRLSCLYVVENTANGHASLSRMFGSNILILHVRIPALTSIIRCDTGWFDAYIQTPNDEFALNYWNGIPYNVAQPSWEVLVEGTFTVADEAERQRVRDHMSSCPVCRILNRPPTST